MKGVGTFCDGILGKDVALSGESGQTLYLRYSAAGLACVWRELTRTP